MSEIAAQEVEIFNLKPSLKDHWLMLLIGILLVPFFGIGLIVIAMVWLTVRSTSYRMTSERIFLRSGFISKKIQETELYRIKDVAFSQGIIQRIFGIGNISIISSDAETPSWAMRSVPNPEQIKETIRTAFRQARKLEGVRVTEHTH